MLGLRVYWVDFELLLRVLRVLMGCRGVLRVLCVWRVCREGVLRGVSKPGLCRSLSEC